MTNLEQRGLVEFLKEQADSGKPIMGICLGMQLLGRGSEEGEKNGLGLIPFDNMGWDIVDFKQKDNKLLEGIGENQRYYFVHSYHAVCDNAENVLMTCDYGYEFAAAVCKDNVYGVQFHPEKSHDFGMRLFENFVRI